MSTLYQIKDWDAHYENSKSRTRDQLSWCPVPNKQDGLGYGLLLREKDGAALYGAFVALVLMASKQRGSRQGFITDTGDPNGRPLTPLEISIKTQMKPELIERMLSVTSCASIGWILVSGTGTAECPPSVPAVSPQGTRKKEEKEGILSDFEKVWKMYPDKSGKAAAEKSYRRFRKEGDTAAEIEDGLERYIAYTEHRRKTEFPDLKFKNGSTWFNQRGWKSEYTIEQAQPAGAPTADEIEARRLRRLNS